MIISRSERSISKYSLMIAHLNYLLLFAPSASEKPNALKNLSFPSFKIGFQCCRAIHIPKAAMSNLTQSSGSPVANRITRVVRIEAQNVLFDYLHCTRNFHFTDAEHISKNSPHFLQSLLSKIDNEKDVTRSLTKFLRYNPINEFEPFFESLGLTPAELSLLLPRKLMFLSDNNVMLENFHHLCDYGIPRTKMGKMYKEAKEIFYYDHGVLAVKLRAYENLGLSKNTIIKLVSCCPSILVGGVNDEFVKFLEKLKGLGMEKDWIKGYLSGKYTYDWNRMLDTMVFLDKLGYSEEYMRNLFKTNPAFLFKGSGKKVYVLFGRLLKLGLKMNVVYSLFSENPQLLSGNGTKNLLQALDFLFEIGVGTEDIAVIVSTNMQLMMGLSSLKKAKSVCKDLNVGRADLCQMVKEDPLKLFTAASKLKINTVKVASQDSSNHLDKATFLLGLGYIENSEEMTKALKQFRGRGDQLQERFNCLVQAGLDFNTVTSIIKRAPMVLNQSKDVIEKKIDCLTNCLGYPLESVVAFPAYLCYDIVRINVRFLMYAWLRERGAAKPTLSLSTLLACSDARFIRYYVDIHPEGPAMWENFKSHQL